MTAGSYRALFDLAGKTAVVTGAAGILGRRFSAGLADFGARVACVDLDGAGAGQIAKEVAATHGVETLGLGASAYQGVVAGLLPALSTVVRPEQATVFGLD